MSAVDSWFLLDEAGDEVLIMMPGGRMVRGQIVGQQPTRRVAAVPFDPADWLDRYTAVGGWYCVTDDVVHFGWPVPNEWRAMATREVYREIEGQPDRVDAVKVLVRERCLMA